MVTFSSPKHCPVSLTSVCMCHPHSAALFKTGGDKTELWLLSQSRTTHTKKNLRNFGVKRHLFVIFLQLGDTIIVASVTASCGCHDYVKWWLLFYVLPGQGAFLQLQNLRLWLCCSAAGHSDFWADPRPGGDLFHISSCGVPGQVRLGDVQVPALYLCQEVM